MKLKFAEFESTLGYFLRRFEVQSKKQDELPPFPPGRAESASYVSKHMVKIFKYISI